MTMLQQDKLLYALLIVFWQPEGANPCLTSHRLVLIPVNNMCFALE